MAHHPYRQSPDELRFQPIFDKIPSRHRREDFSAIGGNGFAAKADIRLPQTSLDLILQPIKSAAANEQNMAGINDLFLRLPSALKLQSGLKLRLKVHRIPQRHFRFFHQFQERGLDSAPADVATGDICAGGDLVDLIDVNNAILRNFDVPVRFLHESANEILDISSDVPGFTEFRRISFDKRNTDQVGDMLDQVGLSNPGRSKQQNVSLAVFDSSGSFRVFFFEPVNAIDVVVMVADGNGQASSSLRPVE